MNNNSLSKSLSIIIDLLVNIQSEQQALYHIIAEDYVVREGEENDFNDKFNRLKKESRESALAQMKAHYIMQADVEDILKGLFTDPEDKL